MDLSALRDLLLPGLWCQGCPEGYESDILLFPRRQSIIIMFQNLKTGRGIVREITREDIADKSYVHKFKPMVLEMREEILSG